MRILLDTTLLIDILRGRREALKLFEEMIERSESLGVSAISVAEVYAGQRPGEEFITAKLFAQVTVHPVTAAIAKKAGLLKQAAARKGQTLLLDDMMVAATALELGCVLHTFNRKHFLPTGVVFYGS